MAEQNVILVSIEKECYDNGCCSETATQQHKGFWYIRNGKNHVWYTLLQRLDDKFRTKEAPIAAAGFSRLKDEKDDSSDLQPCFSKSTMLSCYRVVTLFTIS